jgi:hypothetical protein
MEITAAQFRQSVYKYLDEVLNTGKPLVILKEGKKIQLSPYLEEKKSKGFFFKKKYNKEDKLHIYLSKDWDTEEK